jgi:hypothetical protein
MPDFGVKHHLYADDTQLHVSLSPVSVDTAITKLENTIIPCTYPLTTTSLTSSKAVTTTSKASEFRRIRPVLDSVTAKTVALAMVQSKLDYGNSLFLASPRGTNIDYN